MSKLRLTRHNRRREHKSFHTEGGNEAPLTLMPLTFFSSYQLLCNKPPQVSVASSNIQFIIFGSCSGVQISGGAWLDNSLAPGSINWGHLMVFSWHLGWAAGSQMALLLDLLSKKGRLDLLSKKGRRKDWNCGPEDQPGAFPSPAWQLRAPKDEKCKLSVSSSKPGFGLA